VTVPVLATVVVLVAIAFAIGRMDGRNAGGEEDEDGDREDWL
jgi:hypothetical protein